MFSKMFRLSLYIPLYYTNMRERHLYLQRIIRTPRVLREENTFSLPEHFCALTVYLPVTGSILLWSADHPSFGKSEKSLLKTEIVILVIERETFQIFKSPGNRNRNV